MKEKFKKKGNVFALLLGTIIVCLVMLIIKLTTYSDIKIATPYGNLRYPGKWKEEVRIEKKEQETYSVSFYGLFDNEGEHHLFDVIFGGNEENLIGYINGVNVSLKFYDMDITNWERNQIDTFNAISEDVTYLVSEIEKLDGFSVDGIANIAGEIYIDTKYAKLSYPKKWETLLNVNINEDNIYAVEFYSTIVGKEKVHLFDLYFGFLEDEPIAKLKEDNLNVYVFFYDLNIDDTWSEKDKNICHGMQEDFNYIIDRLIEDGKLEKIN